MQYLKKMNAKIYNEHNSKILSENWIPTVLFKLYWSERQGKNVQLNTCFHVFFK